jgi:hypothetical protein
VAVALDRTLVPAGLAFIYWLTGMSPATRSRFAHAKGVVCHDNFGALGRNSFRHRQPPSHAQPSRDGRSARVVISCPRLCLHDRQLDQTAAALRHVDDRELAARHQCDLRRRHAALFIDHVSDLHALRSDIQKPFLERPDHGLVAALPGAFCQFFCQGLVGVLKSANCDEALYLFQSSAPFLTA